MLKGIWEETGRFFGDVSWTVDRWTVDQWAC